MTQQLRRAFRAVKRLRAYVRFLLTVLGLLVAAARGRASELWVGDSHAAHAHDGTWPCEPLRRVAPGRYAWHIGPRLMWSTARDGLPSAVLRVARLLARVGRSGTVRWFFVFGEIDIRCHLVPRLRDGDAPTFPARYVANVVDVASKATAAAAVIVVPVPPSDDFGDAEGFPIAGTLAERVDAHRRIRRALNDAVAAHGGEVPVYVLDCTDQLAGGDGVLRPELTIDGCHVNDAGRAILRAAVCALPQQPTPQRLPLALRLRVALGPTVRRWRKRLDNPEVKAARLLVERMTPDPPDVLHFGASESLFTAPYDDDQRTLPQLIAAGIGPLSMFSVAGPGYHPQLVRRYLDVAVGTGARPDVVVIGLCVRFGDDAWAKHPEYGYARSLRALDRIGIGKPARRYRAMVRLTNAADFTDYDGVEHPSLVTTQPIGEYRRALKNPRAAGLSDVDATRLLYAYHHGSTAPLPQRYLDDVTALGLRLRELGLKVVVYQMPVAVDRAAELLGDEVRVLLESRMKAMDDAFVAGYGPLDILQTGLSLPTDEFIDPDDATEHVNERGRHRIADQVVAAVRKALTYNAA